MKKVIIADKTLVCSESGFSFREKIEIARQLENLKVDVIELPEIIEEKVDTLLVRTVSSFVKNGVISVGAGVSAGSVEKAIKAISGIKNAKIRIEFPVSPVGLEYVCGKKPAKICDYLKECVKECMSAGCNVEFSACDATRADFELLKSLIKTATELGVKEITVSEDSGETLPDAFIEFISALKSEFPEITLGVSASDKNGLANAIAVMAVRAGAGVVKTKATDGFVSLKTFIGTVYACGNTFGISVNAKATELNRIVKQIEKVTDKTEIHAISPVSSESDGINLVESDTIETVANAVTMLGYDLTEEDVKKVYDEFLKVASKKEVGAKELDAIVSTVAMQVPTTYKLISYVINNGNVITTSASVTLEKDGKNLQAVCLGDGPVDAAFKAIDEIIGHHYELDNFSIKSVTEGKGAVGSALVKLRNNGKLYSGSGISTDIIGASIKAYVSAVNKIAYEEE
ncbi:MAG: hypothetical protein IKJ14_06045 [Clostridia bacterium]|nr:hypothetical protein [Clostridia bacterium]